MKKSRRTLKWARIFLNSPKHRKQANTDTQGYGKGDSPQDEETTAWSGERKLTNCMSDKRSICSIYKAL